MLTQFSMRYVAAFVAVVAVITLSARAMLNRKTTEAPIVEIATPVPATTVPAQTATVSNFCVEPAKPESQLLATESIHTARPEVTTSAESSPVLKVANAYKNGGGFNWDAGTGTPDEIRFKGVRILSKAKSGTYCCGYTFAVAMKTADDNGLLREKSVRQIRRFQQHWYAATDEAKEKQQIYAIQWLGIGREVPLMKAEPGDFLRLWHGSSGHSVILVRWIVEGGKKVGIEYRGTQSSTNGIGNRTEYIEGASKHGTTFDPARTYAARLNAKEPRPQGSVLVAETKTADTISK